MRLSPAAEFAIRGMLVVAERDGQGPVTLATVCQERSLSKQYLAKIFGQLARANLITPIRGKHGGYELAQGLDQISILDIIEAVEGPVALNLCQHQPPKCEEPDCGLRDVWSDLQHIFRDRLGAISLRDCLQPARPI